MCDTNENAVKVLKRRSLQSIQATGGNDPRLLTRHMASKTATKAGLRSGSVKTAVDKESTKKEKNERITNWLTRKDAVDNDVKYWKCLAEERSKALDTTLRENQSLSEENERLTKQLEEVTHERELLEAENKHLSQLAEEAVKLRDLLAECGVE